MIGYGRIFGVQEGAKINKVEAERLLEEDLELAEL
jgi:hypothetical protein